MQELDFRVLLGLLLRHLKVILLVAIVLAVAFAGYSSLFVTDRYASHCSMYVMNISTDAAGNTSGISTTGLAASQQMVNEYITILSSNYVIEDVVKDLARMNYNTTVGGVRSTLSMEAVNGTAMLRITATTADPYLSQAICDALMDNAPEKVTTVMLGLGSVSPVDEAEVGYPVSKNTVRNGVLGAAIGALLCYAVYLMLFLMDNTVKEEKELKERFNVNVLGVVPDMNPTVQKKKKEGK
ncbi:MAG: hypothetical protein IKU51_02725 [Clostridia bacterium]|nr:hypothetical protein [Clostridia bacterium]